MNSPLLMLALDSDVCPTSVSCPVAPLNTYTFLKKLCVLQVFNATSTGCHDRRSRRPSYNRETDALTTAPSQKLDGHLCPKRKAVHVAD